jgi:hypothetical protein
MMKYMASNLALDSFIQDNKPCQRDGKRRHLCDGIDS